MPIISIIVPVFNVELFLPMCIDSILAQSLTDFELLLIDDGSSDSCGSICDRYAQADERVYAFHQSNQGPSAARNLGIKHATGEFFAFVDADDMIALDYLKELYEAMCKNSADVSICGTSHIDESGEQCDVDALPASEVIDSKTAVERCFTMAEGYNGIAMKLFKKSTFTGITFPVGRFYEDSRILFEVMEKASKIVSFRKPLYYYRIRHGSTMNTNSKKQVYDAIDSLAFRLDYLRQNKQYCLSKTCLTAMWSYTYRHLSYFEEGLRLSEDCTISAWKTVRRFTWMILKYTDYSVKEKLRVFLFAYAPSILWIIRQQ